MELKVAAIQANLQWEDKTANLEYFTRKIASINNADIIVLPEMFSTGFTMNAVAMAEVEDGATVEWMKEMAIESGGVICGSVIISENQKYYNRLFWMQPDGNYSTYNKRHLFSMAKENETYTAGDTKLIVEYNGWKICPQICYDLRFPVWNRNAEGYDILINVANWPERRNYPWKILLKARAIENQAFVIGLNRVGEDGNGVQHSGDSAIIDPLGEVISVSAGVESILEAILRKDDLIRIRGKFPFLQDKDQFEIK